MSVLLLVEQREHDIYSSIHQTVPRAVGLSAPAAAERVRKMEDAGVITGYSAQVNPAKGATTVGLDPIALYSWQVPVKNQQRRGVPGSTGDAQTEWQPLLPAQGGPLLDAAFGSLQ